MESERPVSICIFRTRQFNSRLKHLVVRADGNPAALGSSISAAIREIDPAQPIDDVQTMGAIVDRALPHAAA